MNIPQDLKYSKSHEWVRIEGDTAVIGITAYAQDQLGDIVFVELPAVGRDIVANAAFGSIESVKSVSELISPVSGKVTATNGDVVKKPETVNADCYGKGWIVKLSLTNTQELNELMDAAKYKDFVEEVT